MGTDSTAREWFTNEKSVAAVKHTSDYRQITKSRSYGQRG